MQVRFQFRYAYPFDSDLRTAEQFDFEEEHSLTLRRARLRLNAFAFRPWLKAYFQYDLKGAFVRNLRLSIEKYQPMQFKVGLDKADFSRERIISSQRQQFVDRSIVTREFTIDRQEGLELFGRLFEGTSIDSQYYVGVFEGAGRAGSNDGGSPMAMVRYSWNPFGLDVPWYSGDVAFHEKAAVSFSVAAVTNRSRYTRFDTDDGGGALDGFEIGEPGQYRLNQLMGELAYMYRGLSVQGEYHWKEVDDTINQETTHLRGAYIQSGYFMSGLFKVLPKELELAVRYAFVDPNTARPDDLRQEYTAAVNWYFNGHDNKLTLDTTRLTLEAEEGKLSDQRVRLQWDIAF
jgi:phosphate-selective porin